ncbi:hypothetical protein LUZ60_002378 [Juncus effusus]|nr:hypothetical protein LUZ60_002378 [Juncus effusus]
MASEQTARAARAGQETSLQQQPTEQSPNCPRCDSPNTKFCYYNNYSLSQPRHFCKTCRRYWTKGGALRNVPVGGGSRKNKKSKCNSVLSRLSLVNGDSVVGVFSDPGVSLQNLLSGPSQLMPAASDFQLGVLPFSRMHSPSSYNISNTSNNKYISIGDQIIPSHSSAFSPPNISAPNYGNNKINASSSNSSSVDTNIATSIESLSFINQDLHLKLQQQRMSMIFSKESNETMEHKENLEGHVGPLSTDFAETSGLQRGWYVDNSFEVGTGTDTGASIIANDNCNVNNMNNNGNNSSYNWNNIGSSGWNEMPQFTAMP